MDNVYKLHSSHRPSAMHVINLQGIEQIEAANRHIWEAFVLVHDKWWSDDKNGCQVISVDCLIIALCSLSTCVCSPLLSSSPPSVHGLTRGGGDAIGGQSRTVPAASLPQRTGRNPSPPPPNSLTLSYQPEVSAEFLVTLQRWLIRQRWLPDLRHNQPLSELHRKWPQILSTDQCTQL